MNLIKELEGKREWEVKGNTYARNILDEDSGTVLFVKNYSGDDEFVVKLGSNIEGFEFTWFTRSIIQDIDDLEVFKRYAENLMVNMLNKYE